MSNPDKLIPFIILGIILLWFFHRGRKSRVGGSGEETSAVTTGSSGQHERAFDPADLPIFGPIIKQRRLRKEEERRRKEEAEAKRRAEQERARNAYEAEVERPVPPDIKRDMRAFIDGQFVGEDRSPLAYVGYRVGKSRGLAVRDRQRRLEVCFRIEIPAELHAKYSSWGAPVSYQRYRAIERHLKMLADLRRGRSNQKFAVADWETDRAWFMDEYRDLTDLLQRYRPQQYR